MAVNAHNRDIGAHTGLDIVIGNSHYPCYLILLQHIQVIQLFLRLAAAVAQHQLVAFPVQLIFNVVSKLREKGMPNARKQQRHHFRLLHFEIAGDLIRDII
ncbi:hypothetical protein D3C73_1325320 [compost metagenome]